MPRITDDERARFHRIVDSAIDKMNSPKNSKKEHWSTLNIEQLRFLFKKEVDELDEAIFQYLQTEQKDELKDIINFALMMYDNLQGNQ